MSQWTKGLSLKLHLKFGLVHSMVFTFFSFSFNQTKEKKKQNQQDFPETPKKSPLMPDAYSSLSLSTAAISSRVGKPLSLSLGLLIRRVWKNIKTRSLKLIF